jgi:hypothetical protein
MTEHHPESLSDLRDAIARLCRDIGSLKGEVNELSNLIGRFAAGRRLRPINFTDMAAHPSEKERTPEPKSSIEEALYLLRSANTVQELSLLQKAISRDLDGALRDIRSAKLDVRAILDDSDLRDEFRAWKGDG